MKINIVGRKLKLTSSIKNFIQSKVENSLSYLHNIVWVNVIVGVEKKQHFVEVVVHVGHQTLTAKGVSDDLYSAVDIVLDKIESQARKYKEKKVDLRKDVGDIDYTMPTVGEVRFSVIKNVPIKPMTKEEAVVEMERLGYNFWLFLNKDTNQTNVVFKRLDSTYGIIVPLKK